MTSEERTIQSLFNLWFWNFQNASIQQFSNLYHSTISIMKYYNKEGKYDSDLEKLKELYFHPILKLREIYPTIKISKNPVDWDISKLEWCYFRDTRFKVKLGTEYTIDARKMQETKKIFLSEIITVLSLFKSEMFNRIVKIMLDEKLELFISLPNMTKEITQLEGGTLG